MAKTTKSIVENAIVAALYFVVTMLTLPFAYEAIQFRIAEFFVLLCFYRKDLVFGVTIGCFLANIPSTLGVYDMVFGTLATLLSALCVAFLSPRLLVAIIYPIAFNSLIVGLELHLILELPFWINALYVALGEGAVMVASYAVWLALSRLKSFRILVGDSKRANVKW